MRVGLTLAGANLTEDGAKFAAELGVTDVVVHLTNYQGGGDQRAYLAGEAAGPAHGDARTNRLWTFDDFTRLIAMLGRHGLKLTALENFSPNFWSDILLGGPKKREQMDDLKRLVGDAGKAGVPVIGYNFSIAGVWGWMRKPVGRGGAITAYMPLGKGRVSHDPTLIAVGNAHGVLPSSVSLAWLLQKGMIVIPASAKPEHMKANLTAASVRLTADEISAIDRLDRGERIINPTGLAPMWDD